MALGIEAREASTTIVLIFDIDDDLGSRSPCAAIDVIRIGHNEIGALRSAAKGTRRLLYAAEGVVSGSDGPEHDHAGSEDELGMSDAALAILYDEVAPEAERIA